MNNLNAVLLEGNLCRDPELRYTTKGTAVCTLVVASNRSYKVEDERQEEVSFFETTTWGKLATTCAEYLVKGRGVRVVGRLKQDRWEDGEGNPRARIVVVAEHVEFKPQRRSEHDDEGASDPAAARAEDETEPQAEGVGEASEVAAIAS